MSSPKNEWVGSRRKDRMSLHSCVWGTCYNLGTLGGSLPDAHNIGQTMGVRGNGHCPEGFDGVGSPAFHPWVLAQLASSAHTLLSGNAVRARVQLWNSGPHRAGAEGRSERAKWQRDQGSSMTRPWRVLEAQRSQCQFGLHGSYKGLAVARQVALVTQRSRGRGQ